MASENAAAQPVVHIVDDDEGLRESLAFLLRSASLEVRTLNRPKHSSINYRMQCRAASLPMCECRI